MKKIFFSLNKEDEKLLHQRNEKIAKRVYKDDDAREKDYYYHVISRIKNISSYKITGWNYWNQHYGNKNWALLEAEPYFGSVLEKGKTRVYIGKQSFYDIDKSESLVFDWRSTFGDLYYRRKQHSFIENRYVELEDIREYVDKYIYVDLLTDDYSDFLEESLKSKAAGFLGDIVETIDDVQNDIIRSIDNKYEIIDGGPGTGKTTIGLHILSYKTYHYTKAYKIYPKISIIIANDLFKLYINEALVNLDLYGKNYHNTEIYSFKDVLSKDKIKCDYAFVDEAQDFSESDFKKLLNIIDAKNTIICVDNNQNITNADGFDLVDYFNANNYEYNRRYINKNYRNPIRVSNFAEAITGALQLPINKKDSSINFAIWNEYFDPDQIIINYLLRHKDELNSIIYLDLESKKYIDDILSKEHIKYSDGIEHLSQSNSIIVLSPKEAKGFEFDNVIVIGKDIDLNDLIKKHEFYVSITRTMNDLLVVSNNFFNDLKFDNEFYSYPNEIMNSYYLFLSGFLEKSTELVANVFFNDVINSIININDPSVLEYLEIVISAENNANCFVHFDKNVIIDLLNASRFDIVILLLKNKTITFKDLLDRVDHEIVNEFVVSNIDDLIVLSSQEELIFAFNLIDLKIVIDSVERMKRNVEYSSDIKDIILKSEFKYDINLLSKCLDLSLLKKKDLYKHIIYHDNNKLLEWLSRNLDRFISILDLSEMIMLFKKIDHKRIIESIKKTKVKIQTCEQITTLILDGVYGNDIELLGDYYKNNVIPINTLFEHIINCKNDDLTKWFEESLLDQFIINANKEQIIQVFEIFDLRKVINSIKRTSIKVKRTSIKVLTSTRIKNIIFKGEYSNDVSLLNDCLSMRIIDKESLFNHIINDAIFLIDNYYESYLNEIVEKVLGKNTYLIEYIKDKAYIISCVKTYLLNGLHFIKLMKFNKVIKNFSK